MKRTGIYLLFSLGLLACSDTPDPGSPGPRRADEAAREPSVELRAAVDAAAAARGAEKEQTIWTRADKQGFGTAMSVDSKVWYTLQGGRLTEVYFPDLGTPAVRTLEFVVTDGREAALATEGSTQEVRLVDEDSLTYQLINTDGDGRWRLTTTYVTDPARSTVMVDVKFESLCDAPMTLHVSYDPSLTNDGLDDTGWAEGEALLAADSASASALVASPAFSEATSTADGDVVQTGRVALDGVEHQHAALSLGFGADSDEALAAASASLDSGFEDVAHDYAAGWHDYVASLVDPPASLENDLQRATYRVSTMVLAASEDKTYRGAYIASPSMPWVWGDGLEDPSGAYHLVWSRDLYGIATALIAQGDVAGAERALDYLFNIQQKPDGSFPQNSTVDGTPHWGNLQLDEVADPIILAHLLGRDDADTWAHVKLAADFIINFEQKGMSAPWTPQERWENQGGFSPATIASEIAGLASAADIAEANGDAASAELYRSTAESWRDELDTWTVTTNGPFSSEPYFLRLSKDGDADAGTLYSVGDGGPSEIDQREVVDTSFLELVRLGIRDPHDPAIRSTLPVVDEQLLAETANGKFWRRYNFDGYGETAEGGPWDVSDPDTFATMGRAWPILAGERGEYELMAGNAEGAREALESIALAGNDGYMLPEQVWDERPPTGEAGFPSGEGTFSATPLIWSHAEFVRLAHNLEKGDCAEKPDSVRRLR